MSEGPGQQQRYCTNCGAEIRPGNSFCVSCGQRLDAGDEDHVDENTNPIKKFYEETQGRYRQWSEAQAAERQRNEVLRAIQAGRNARRARFDRYVAFFERAHTGAQTSLEWWQAYEEDEESREEGQTTDQLLISARERAEAGLVKMRGLEETFASLLQADSFGEADDLLNRLLADQEDFDGEESVFPPLVEVHERIKHSEGWTTYRRELEKFIKDLEDLLDSPAVRTVPANKVRFPEPGQEHPSQPEVSYPHDLAPEEEVPLPPPPRESLTGRIREWTSTASTGQQWMIIGMVFVALVGIVLLAYVLDQASNSSQATNGAGRYEGGSHYTQSKKEALYWLDYVTAGDADSLALDSYYSYQKQDFYDEALFWCRLYHFRPNNGTERGGWYMEMATARDNYGFEYWNQAANHVGIPTYKNECDRLWELYKHPRTT